MKNQILTEGIDFEENSYSPDGTNSVVFHFGLRSRAVVTNDGAERVNGLPDTQHRDDRANDQGSEF